MLTALSGLVSSPFVFAQDVQVRVALLQEVSNVRVTVLAPCRLTDLRTGVLVKEWQSLKWQLVEASPQGLKVGPVQTGLQAVLLQTGSNDILRINARPYRGSLIFLRTPNGRLTIVNRLGLEEYLVGALSSEVGTDWPLETLKAHAVVSRTMVAHRIWIQRERPFDVTDDTSTHVYHGVVAESAETLAAVRQTEGQVLAYAGELISAAFHASCGGHTEDASELWKTKTDVPPLQGRPDPYCRDLRHYRWQTGMSLKAFAELLGAVGKEIGMPTACEVSDRNRSGRVRTVRLQGDRGVKELSGRDFRQLLGANRLKSLNFTVTFSRGISFSGFGWGHGVGLCQWGAYGMAKQGHTADEILQFYFPGAERRKLQGLPGFP